MENKYYVGRKHCEKRRNCLLQAIAPFLTMFSTVIHCISFMRQNAVLCGNGLNDIYWYETKLGIVGSVSSSMMIELGFI